MKVFDMVFFLNFRVDKIFLDINLEFIKYKN